jgi:hypothetical protein
MLSKIAIAPPPATSRVSLQIARELTRRGPCRGERPLWTLHQPPLPILSEGSLLVGFSQLAVADHVGGHTGITPASCVRPTRQAASAFRQPASECCRRGQRRPYGFASRSGRGGAAVAVRRRAAISPRAVRTALSDRPRAFCRYLR